jgi:hypothetical protein
MARSIPVAPPNADGCVKPAFHQGILTIGGTYARLDTPRKIQKQNPKAKIQISQERTGRS